MGLFNLFFTNKKKPKGLIGYYGLEEWWLETLSESERNEIKRSSNPLGFSKDKLDNGKIEYSSQSVIGFLNDLSTYFRNTEQIDIRLKILKHAEGIIDHDTPIVDIHFLYSALISTFYKGREINEEYYNLSKAYSEKQIAISPEVAKAFKKEHPNAPLSGHAGYYRLCVSLMKEGHYKKVIELASKAKKEGWIADWDKRIERATKKLNQS